MVKSQMFFKDVPMNELLHTSVTSSKNSDLNKVFRQRDPTKSSNYQTQNMNGDKKGREINDCILRMDYL